MAEELEKSLSVIIPTNRGKDLLRHYLPQLCAHLQECSGIAAYEVVVSDCGEEASGSAEWQNLAHVRYLHASNSMTEVDNLNHALFAAVNNYILVLDDDMLPTPNFTSEMLNLFRYVPSLFGASGATIQTYNEEQEGPKTLDQSKMGIALKTVRPQNKKPVYTLALSEHNLFADRVQLCMMGGFRNLFNTTKFAKYDCCIRAWRFGRKCLYAPSAYCKKLVSDEQALPEGDTFSYTDAFSDHLLLNYLHSNRFSHAFFWIRLLANLVRLSFDNSTRAQEQKKAYRQFFKNHKKNYNERRWSKHQRLEPFDKIANGFFSGPQLQELTVKD